MEEVYLEYADQETLENFYGFWVTREKKTTKHQC
jgi:hypothetical protein